MICLQKALIGWRKFSDAEVELRWEAAPLPYVRLDKKEGNGKALLARESRLLKKVEDQLDLCCI